MSLWITAEKGVMGNLVRTLIGRSDSSQRGGLETKKKRDVNVQIVFNFLTPTSRCDWSAVWRCESRQRLNFFLKSPFSFFPTISVTFHVSTCSRRVFRRDWNTPYEPVCLRHTEALTPPGLTTWRVTPQRCWGIKDLEFFLSNFEGYM